MKEMIRDYKIIGEIGAGGMGTVYKALHPGLRTPVIIKKLVPVSSDSQERFKREAKIMMSMRNDNIVPVFDYFTDAGERYIVMEFVDGVPLSELIAKQGKIDPRIALLIFNQVALGLEYAHGKSVIHRDLKPHNILVSRKGEVKIIDFGIASVNEEPVDDRTRQALTRTGTAIGTPAYMPPEQIGDLHSASARADIFAMGIILFEMLTGARPFDNAMTEEAVARRYDGFAGDARRLDPTIPVPINAVILKCLRPNPDERFRNMAQPRKKLEWYHRKLSAGEIREAIAAYAFKSAPAPALDRMKPLYTSFTSSFRESRARKYALVGAAAAIVIGALAALFIYTDAYYRIFLRNRVGALEVRYLLPVRAPLRGLAWYRQEGKLPDRSRNPGIYEERSKQAEKVLAEYIKSEYGDMLFNFQLAAWLVRNKGMGGAQLSREKLVLSPSNYIVPAKNGDFTIRFNDDGSLPEHLVLSSGKIYRAAGSYSTVILLNGASYRTHFLLEPAAKQEAPRLIDAQYKTTPRNKITFNFAFTDASTGKSVDGVKVMILWGADYFDWSEFSKKKERMDYLWNGRSFTFKISHPDYRTPRTMDIMVDRDQTIANVEMRLEKTGGK